MIKNALDISTFRAVASMARSPDTVATANWPEGKWHSHALCAHFCAAKGIDYGTFGRPQWAFSTRLHRLFRAMCGAVGCVLTSFRKV